MIAPGRSACTTFGRAVHVPCHYNPDLSWEHAPPGIHHSTLLLQSIINRVARKCHVSGRPVSRMPLKVRQEISAAIAKVHTAIFSCDSMTAPVLHTCIIHSPCIVSSTRLLLLLLLLKLHVAPGIGGPQWHPVSVVLCQRLRVPQAQAARPEGQAHSEAHQEADSQTSAEADEETWAEADAQASHSPATGAEANTEAGTAADSQAADSEAAHRQTAHSQAANSQAAQSHATDSEAANSQTANS